MATLDQATWRSRLRKRLRDETASTFPDALLDEVAIGAFAAIYPAYYRFVFSTPTAADAAGFMTVPSGQDINHVFAVELDDTVTGQKGVDSGLPWFKRGNQLGGLTPSTSFVVVSHEPLPAPTSSSQSYPDTAVERALLYGAGQVCESMVYEKARWRRWEPSDPDRVDENELLAACQAFYDRFAALMDSTGGMGLPAIGL